MDTTGAQSEDVGDVSQGPPLMIGVRRISATGSRCSLFTLGSAQPLNLSLDLYERTQPVEVGSADGWCAQDGPLLNYAVRDRSADSGCCTSDYFSCLVDGYPGGSCRDQPLETAHLDQPDAFHPGCFQFTGCNELLHPSTPESQRVARLTRRDTHPHRFSSHRSGRNAHLTCDGSDRAARVPRLRPVEPPNGQVVVIELCHWLFSALDPDALALVIMAWNAHRRGAMRSKLQMPKGGLTPENFPEPR